MIEHHGWHIPASFGSPEREAAQVRDSVGLADISWMLTFNLQGTALKDPPAVGPEACWWLLGRLRGLVTCEPSAGNGLRERFQQLPMYVTDVSSCYTQLLLAGPCSREVLNKLTSLNLAESALENLHGAQASVAHVQSVVLRKDLKGIPAYHLLVGREYGESVWESVLHAGHEFHILPFGLEALRLLQG
jgi:glycine cleavage system aminomethyltransferase T